MRPGGSLSQKDTAAPTLFLVDDGHVGGGTPSCPTAVHVQLQEQTLMPHCKEEQGHLISQLSHRSRGIIIHRDIRPTFNVQTVFAPVFHWPLILYQIREQRNTSRSVLEE